MDVVVTCVVFVLQGGATTIGRKGAVPEPDIGKGIHVCLSQVHIIMNIIVSAVAFTNVFLQGWRLTTFQSGIV